MILGGADVIRQALAAGLVDELRIHLIALPLGEGTRLFEPVPTGPLRMEVANVVPLPWGNAPHLPTRGWEMSGPEDGPDGLSTALGPF